MTQRVVRLLDRKLNVECETLPIVKGIPIPEQKSPRGLLTRTLHIMEIGDSILVKRKCTTQLYVQARAIGIRITAQRNGEMVRVWRMG